MLLVGVDAVALGVTFQRPPPAPVVDVSVGCKSGMSCRSDGGSSYST
jgi:hypothetical protein